MIIVHEVFICKPGNASKLAKMFKEGMATEKNVSIMTDVTGQFNRVIIASWYDSLTAWEKVQEEYKNPTPEQKEAWAKMGNYTEMYLTGSREIYHTW